jgi:hypothetical protein
VDTDFEQSLMCRAGALVVTLSALLALSATSALAELVVSTVTKAPGFAVGAKFPDDHTFDLPDGSELKLLRTPSGAQFEMRGPFKGTLEKFNRDCNGWVAFTHAYCRAKSAGDQLPVGGTRGAPTPSQ